MQTPGGHKHTDCHKVLQSNLRYELQATSEPVRDTRNDRVCLPELMEVTPVRAIRTTNSVSGFPSCPPLPFAGRAYILIFFFFLGECPGRKRIVQKNSSSQGSGKGQVCDGSRGMRGRSHGGAGGPRGLSSDWMDVVVIDSFCAGCQGGSLQLKEVARDIWQERDSQILGAH